MGKAVKSVSPPFAYRGDRTFINSASIYEAILENLGAAGMAEASGAVYLTIRRMTHAHLKIFYGAPGDEPSPVAVADLTLDTDDGPVVGWLEDTGIPVLDRLPYDEAVIESLGVIEGNVMGVNGDGGYSPAQVATSSARRLHDALHPPGPGQKWLCVRIDLDRPLRADDTDGLSISIRRNIHDVLTVTALERDGVTFGRLGFSLATG